MNSPHNNSLTFSRDRNCSKLTSLTLNRKFNRERLASENRLQTSQLGGTTKIMFHLMHMKGAQPYW